MGVHENIDAERWPKQGTSMNRRVSVCFKYDTTREIGGVVVRDDTEEPGQLIIRLDDGRVVLATECMYSLTPQSDAPVPSEPGFVERLQRAIEEVAAEEGWQFDPVDDAAVFAAGVALKLMAPSQPPSPDTAPAEPSASPALNAAVESIRGGVADTAPDALRERIADELERQIVEDFRNPRLGAPDIDGKIPRWLMVERADRILALTTPSTPATCREPSGAAGRTPDAEAYLLAIERAESLDAISALLSEMRAAFALDPECRCVIPQYNGVTGACHNCGGKWHKSRPPRNRRTPATEPTE